VWAKVSALQELQSARGEELRMHPHPSPLPEGEGVRTALMPSTPETVSHFSLKLLVGLHDHLFTAGSRGRSYANTQGNLCEAR
jgi:hypothetical protein